MATSDAGQRDPLLGKTLGGLYRVQALIGEGGMGTVYEAEHIHLGKTYALKVLNSQRSHSEKAMKRFLIEAKASSHVEHPHIVKVMNFDVDADGRVFIVMERLRGESLAERIAAGPLPVAEALAIAAQVADALQAAHEHGVVHRDLKPDNIFLCEGAQQPNVKVLDFGISKFKQPEDNADNLTETDQLLGTPLYASPELVRGDAIDQRTDIYALAVIAYEMIVGKPPFVGDNRFQLMWKHGNETPTPPSMHVPNRDIPRHVEKAIMRGLRKVPAERFESMHAFRNALHTIDRSARNEISRGMLWWSFVAIALCVLGYAGWLVSADREFAQPTHTSATPRTQTGGTETADAGKNATQVLLRVESVPAGAVVMFNGERVGQTPLRTWVPRGVPAELQLSRPGYMSATRTVELDSEELVRLTLRKRDSKRPPPIKLEF